MRPSARATTACEPPAILARAAPELRVVVLEQLFACYGASGSELRLADELDHRRPRQVRAPARAADACSRCTRLLIDIADEVLGVV